jgi:ATP-dependent helicase/nuclease subunit A
MTLSELLERFLLTDLELDDRQFAAVMADRERDKTAYRILVTAPAGAGKTRVLASRYLKLLVDGEKPENIVAITFTRKAAGEMKNRVVEYLFAFRELILAHKVSSPVAKTITDTDSLNKMVLAMRISTIDSFLANIIRIFPGESGVNPNFTVVDEIEEEELIDRTIDDYIEERMEHDRNIIELLRFFDFRYLVPEKSYKPCLFPIVRNIIRQWENFYDTIELIKSVPEETLLSWLTQFIGQELHFDDHLQELIEIAKNLKPAASKQHKLKPFIDYVLAANASEIKEDDSQFLSFRPIFLTNENTIRKIPSVKFSEQKSKGLFCSLSDRYAKCITDLLLVQDVKNLRLAKPFVYLLVEIGRLIRERKRDLGILGMGDLKTTIYSLLNTHAERFNVLYNMDARVNHYLIDEFQDTDPIQWRIFQKLTEDWFSGETAKQERNVVPTLFLVGDEKQSIYGFRNADVSIINDLKETEDIYTVPFPLEKNYRSKKEIIASVNTLFAHHMRRREDRPSSVAYKDMKPHDKKGKGLVSVIEVDIEGKKEERTPILANLVAEAVNAIHDRTAAWGDIALLFRDSLSFHFYEREFEDMGIPYISSGGKSFFDNAEVNEIVKILNFLDNPHDDINFSALFLSPLFEFGIRDLLLLVYTHATHTKESDTSFFQRLRAVPSDRYAGFLDTVCGWLNRKDMIRIEQLIEEILLETNAYGILIDRRGGQKDVNIRKLMTLIEHISSKTTGFSFFFDKLNRIIRAREKNAEIDIGTAFFELEERSAVHLMTVHKAKGLEFPVVIIPQVDSAEIKTRIERIALDRDKPHLLFLKKHKKMESPLLRRYKQRIYDRDEEELKRILYVALTRAMNELHLFVNMQQAGKRRVWMNIVCDSPLKRITKPEVKPVTREEEIVAVPGERGLYEFTLAQKARPLVVHTLPSELDELSAPFSVERERAKLKGSVLHKLFELVSAEKLDHGNQGDVAEASKTLVRQFDEDFVSDEELVASVLTDFRNTLKNKDILEVVTDPEGISEFAYSLERTTPDGSPELVSGIIDRILHRENEIFIYDYKSNNPAGRAREQFIRDMKEEYKEQLNEYRSAARMRFGIEHIRTFLILTAIREIIEI